jgi:CRISPR/Cas system-associated exonuclease Cas4 (RecB family)
VNQKEAIPELDASTLQRMQEGTVVGELATQLFPEGVTLADLDFEENISQTQSHLKNKKPLFEAGFLVDNLFSRVDILRPNEDGSFDIIEVKSATKVKPENIHDVSFQKHCLELSGLIINKTFLCHIDTSYVRQGDLELEKLFTLADITEEVIAAQEGITERITEIQDMLNKPTHPEVAIGSHCSSPYTCPLKYLCWKDVPEDNVFDLYRGGKRSQSLFDEDVVEIKHIPKDTKLNNNQQIQRACAISGETHVHTFEIKQFIKTYIISKSKKK